MGSLQQSASVPLGKPASSPKPPGRGTDILVKYVETYVWAMDADHALELSGAGVEDFKTPEEAKKAWDQDFHEGRVLFKIEVSEVK